MAFNNNYQFQPRWVRDNRGNAQTTVWLESKTDKKGNAYWGGSLLLSNGKRLGFIVNGVSKTVQRGSREVMVTPLKVTVLQNQNIAPVIGL